MTTRKLDFSPRKTLADSRGELWVEMKHDEEWLAGRSASTVVDELVGLVLASKLGKYSGRSEGSGAFDVSFTVKNRKAAAPLVKALLKQHFPGLAYSVSDEYEARFHEEKESTVLERIHQLEQMALYLYNGLGAIRAQLEADANGAD